MFFLFYPECQVFLFTPGVIYSICPAFCPPVDGRGYLLFNVRIEAFSVL